MGRKSASVSRIREEQPGSYFIELRHQFFGFLVVKTLKFFDADPGSGMETVGNWATGWKKVGSEKHIPDPQHCGRLIHSSGKTHGGTVSAFPFSAF
jgi:hypothetical protein